MFVFSMVNSLFGHLGIVRDLAGPGKNKKINYYLAYGFSFNAGVVATYSKIRNIACKSNSGGKKFKGQ